jgi:type II secretory ATPase GspE/PulE/Tfp pilus assembly ATPase PilB-like protein
MSNSENVDFHLVVHPNGSIENTVRGFVEQATDLHASDLFFAAEEDGVTVSVRRLGTMLELGSLSSEDGRHCVNHIKAMAGIDLAERRRPLDGRWIYERDGRKTDLRINSLPTLYGEDLTIRILNREMAVRSLDRLGLLPEQLQELTAMLDGGGGLILATGPNGSGKTTTLYGCLHRLNDGTRKINTIEDPIEYAVDGLRQSQVNMNVGLEFPELLRSVLRQSPDVIMIGEIRDSVTAQTAIRAANSGQLVFSTLHAPIAAGAIQSMLSLDVHRHFLATCLRGIITQRLVRVLCPACKQAIDLQEAPATFEAVQRWLKPGEGTTMFTAKGCPQCRETGFVDRTGVFEVLPATGKIRKLISSGATSREIESEAIAEGMIEFGRSGMVKVAQGVTSTEELLRVVPTEYLGIEG